MEKDREGRKERQKKEKKVMGNKNGHVPFARPRVKRGHSFASESCESFHYICETTREQARESDIIN